MQITSELTLAQFVHKTGVCFTPRKHPEHFGGTCVYVHRRWYDGAVFYVGLGNRNRAMTASCRNEDWETVALAYGYTVQVVEVFDDPKAAARAEVELIDLALKMGCELSNRSPGGEGCSLHVVPLRDAVAHAHALVRGLRSLHVAPPVRPSPAARPRSRAGATPPGRHPHPRVFAPDGEPVPPQRVLGKFSLFKKRYPNRNLPSNFWEISEP